MLLLLQETSRYSLLAFFIRSLLEGGEKDEGTVESQLRSFVIMILRIFSEGEKNEDVISEDSDSVLDSSSKL